MYIWILLATIMVALSFFNLSPRQDKENSFSEIKVASIVSRFKVENLAVARYLQCDTILRLHTNNWDASAPPYSIDIKQADPFNFKTAYQGINYPSLQEVLPIGYKANEASLNAKHYLYCMDRQLEVAGAQQLDECRFGSAQYPTYVVSFAQIPDRWLSKDGSNTPLPAFVQFLSDKSHFGGIAGYTECDADYTCKLKGGGARHLVADIDDDTKGSEGISVNLIDRNSTIWQNTKFRELCGQNIPCMFMYRKMPTTDEKAYCRKIFHDVWNSEAATGGATE